MFKNPDDVYKLAFKESLQNLNIVLDKVQNEMHIQVKQKKIEY